MKSLIRESILRNLVVEKYPGDRCYGDLTPSDANVNGNLIACGNRWLALASQNGGIDVLGVQQTGREKPIHTGAKQTIDIAFSPHDLDLFQASSDSGLCTLYRMGQNECDEIGVLDSGSTKLKNAQWHPSAANVSSLFMEEAVQVWDTERMSEIRKLSPSCRIAYGCWVSSKLCGFVGDDSSLNFADVRSDDILTTKAHSSKCVRVVEGVDEFTMLTTGQSMVREREVALWDIRKHDSAVTRSRIDTGNSVIIPLVLRDLKLLLLQARGETSLKAFEIDSSALHVISNNIVSQTPMTGACLMPVSACDVMDCEVSRVLRLTRSNIESIRCEIPRRLKSTFHDDLFPDTADCTRAGMTKEEWLNGSDAENPKISVLKLRDLVRNPSTSSVVASGGQQVDNTPVEEPEAVNEPEPAETVYEASKMDKIMADKMGYVPKMKYAKAIQPKRDDTLYNLNPASIPCLALGSAKFALSWQGGGGPVYIGNINDTGKMEHPDKVPLINGHSKPVMALAFDPFDDELLVTGSEDCHIKLWRGSEEVGDLLQHQSSVRNLAFHPCARGVLASGGQDCTVRVWDVNTQSEICKHYQGTDPVQCMDWSYDGSQMAVMWRTSAFDIFDPRIQAGAAMKCDQSHAGAKPAYFCWLGDSQSILTSGFNKIGSREFNVWDARKLESPVSSTKLGMGGSTSFQPYFVEENGVVILAARGENTMLVYEIEGLSRVSSMEYKDKFESHRCNSASIVGPPSTVIAQLPRRVCDTGKVEFARLMRLSDAGLESVAFTIPRAADLLEYFADDVYPNTRSGKASMTAAEWQSGANAAPDLMCMNVSGMQPLSERDPTLAHAAMKRAQQKTEMFRKLKEEEDAKVKAVDDAFLRMQNLAIEHSKFHPNLSSGGAGGHDDARQKTVVTHEHEDVADDEWDD